MRAISYTAIRKTLASTMEKVCDDHDPVIVTRKNNKSVILISLEDYESLTETAYLLQNPKNAKRLLSSIEELEAGKGKRRELIE